MNSYLGQTPVFGDFPFQILSGDGTSFYELNFKTNGTNGLLVFLNGAVQRPGIDFTCDGNALTFSANVSVGVQIFVYGMGLPKSSLAPSAGSVGLAEISNEIRAFDSDAQDWTNLLKLLTPKGLDDSFKGSNQLLANNGYQKLPGGLIIQWGNTNQGTVANGVANIAFPIAFPNACQQAYAFDINAALSTVGSGGFLVAASAWTTTSVEVQWYRVVGSTGGLASMNWFAIGY